MELRIVKEERILPYSLRYEIEYDKDLLRIFSKNRKYSWSCRNPYQWENLLEVIKDLGNAEAVCARYNLDKLSWYSCNWSCSDGNRVRS